MVPNCQSSDAGDLNMRKESHNARPLSGKVKDAPLNKKKNCMLRLLTSMVFINFLSIKLWKKKKKFVLVLLLCLKLQKLWPQCMRNA